MRLERSELAIRREGLPVHNRVEVHFESIALQDQRVRGLPDDYLLAVVHFDFRYPDGRIDTGCIATIRHRFRHPSGEIVEVTVPGAYDCPTYGRSLERAIEEYYRQRVGADGSTIRVGPQGVSPFVIGVPRESIASAAFSIDAPEPGA